MLVELPGGVGYEAAMRREDKAQKIADILNELYPSPPIPLDHSDSYTLLIAVLLSAQCTDERVNLVTPGLFARAGSPEAMARLSVEDILAEIKSCGLAPTKAKNIHRLSQTLVERYGGGVPAEMKLLEELPGVGHKTASVVMSQAFGEPAFAVDTHIFRNARRWGLSRGTTVEHVEKDLKKVFPTDTWNKVHLQIIYFGREYCPARGHDVERCPICSWGAVKAMLALEEKSRSRKRKAG